MRTLVVCLVLMAAAVAPAHAAVGVGWQDQRAAISADEAPQAYEAARFIGAREMRLILVWHRVQPAPNVWHWEQFDAAVERARDFNIQLVIGGLGARPPGWAGSSSEDPIGAGSWRNLDDLAYVRFVTAAARRYAGRVRLWSIINEPDLTGYPAERYAALFVRSRRAIRRFAGPRARVLWGEFSPNAPLSYSLRALDASKHRIVADGFAIHPYGGAYAQLEGGIGRLGAVKQRLARWARRTRKPLTLPDGHALTLYGTEYGCSTLKHDEHECARQWDTALREATAHGLRQLVAYQLVPADQPTWDTSLLRPDGTPSLAMQLIAAWPRHGR